jgi:hypothetical protein
MKMKETVHNKPYEPPSSWPQDIGMVALFVGIFLYGGIPAVASSVLLIVMLLGLAFIFS